MSRIEINGGGHQIVVDCNVSDLAYVVEKAQKLWQETKGADHPGPAYGFSMERDRGLNVHRDKRLGGEIEPIRVSDDSPNG